MDRLRWQTHYGNRSLPPSCHDIDATHIVPTSLLDPDIVTSLLTPRWRFINSYVCYGDTNHAPDVTSVLKAVAYNKRDREPVTTMSK